MDAHPVWRLWIGAMELIVAVGLIAALVASGAHAQSSGKIYRCNVNGQLVFTDRSCAGETGTEVELSPVNLANAHDGGSPSKDVSAKSSRSSGRPAKEERSIAEEQSRARLRCERLAHQLETIRSRMRAGYTAEQGERLRDRQRDLEAQRRMERCRI